MNQAQKIANNLSDAQRKTLLNDKPNLEYLPPSLRAWGKRIGDKWPNQRLSPLGKEVKAILEKQDGSK